jgi:hypothetical protein
MARIPAVLGFGGDSAVELLFALHVAHHALVVRKGSFQHYFKLLIFLVRILEPGVVRKLHFFDRVTFRRVISSGAGF